MSINKIKQNIEQALSMPQDEARDAYLKYQKALLSRDILKLRAKGLSIGQISIETGLTITEISEVIYDQNNRDKYDSGNQYGYKGVF